MEISLSHVAIFISLISIAITLWFNFRKLEVQNMSNLSHMIAQERFLADIPSAFRFHGITDDQIKNAGITAEELSYLVSSITAGGVYHRTHSPNCAKSFDKGSYRYNMIKSEEFRKAWPLVKQMMNKTSFTTKIDNTINLIENT